MKKINYKRTILVMTAFVLLVGCSNTENPVQNMDAQDVNISRGKNTITAIPTVTTTSATEITPFTAKVGGSYTSNLKVTASGICYNTSPNPKKSDGFVSSTSISGTNFNASFNATIPGVKPNTLYYARAFSNNSDGISYGSQITFTTQAAALTAGTVTDYDGNVYNTITYGNQVWTVENLRTTHYRNGNEIPNITGNAEWSALTTGAYCNYSNSTANVSTYGRLYNWYAVSDSRNIAPTGWHVATYEEWQTLVTFLGGSEYGGAAAKEAGLAHWLTPNYRATNSGGFNSVPSGARYSNGTSNASFSALTRYSPWWTASSTSSDNAKFVETDYGSTRMYRSSYAGLPYNNKHTGYAVRLVKD